jgi:uncharacterized protein (DUF433 family)
MNTIMCSSELKGGPVVTEPPVAFTTDQVIRLTGLTRRKLEYWIETGVLTADIDLAKGRGRVRLFSFQNLIEARTAAWLRDKISLQLIRKIIVRLRGTGTSRPLASVRFGVIEFAGRSGADRYEVVLERPDGGWESWRRPGQLIMELTVPIEAFAASLRAQAAADRAAKRRIARIERRRGVLGSASVVAGTRVPTMAIWNLHRAGMKAADIAAEFPGITVLDVRAAIEHEQGRADRTRRTETA